MDHTQHARRMTALFCAAALVGCASGSNPFQRSSSSSSTSSAPAPAPAPAAQARPAWLDANGEVTDSKAWIPWYFGSDRYRHEFAYKGMGRLIFAGSGGFDSNAHLIWIIHNRNDSGFR